MKMILGSGSKSRREVLEQAGYEFEVVTADIDEKAIRHDDPQELVLAIARAKADAILPNVKEAALVVTADQVVVCNGKVFGKPKDEEQAREYLHCYAQHPLETRSALVVTNTQTGKRAEGIDIAKLYIDPLPESVIDELIWIGKIMHCSGAIRVEEPPVSDYIRRFDGTTDSTSGMPLKLLKKLMEQVM